jgi:hypothetical protein
MHIFSVRVVSIMFRKDGASVLRAYPIQIVIIQMVITLSG